MRNFLIRMAALAAAAAAILLWASCGDTFRPIITPFPQPGGDPQGVRRAIVLNTGGLSANGATNNIDVSGDTDVQDLYVGTDPVMMALSGNIFVVNRGSKNVSTYSPFFTSGTPTTASLPTNSSPVFAAGALNNVYVADPANNVVDILSGGSTNTGTIAVGTNPVAIASTPDGTKVYVVNQGSDNVSLITTANDQVATTIALAAGASPVYAAASADSKWIMVAEQGTGQVALINTSDNSVTEIATAAGPSYVTFDKSAKRFYVVNTAANSISIFDETLPTPALLATIGVGAGPTAVAALADGSRAYTANHGAGTVSVVDVRAFKKIKDVTVAAAGEQVMWVAASSDSRKVYAAVKGPNNTSDPGFTAILQTSTDTQIGKIPPPRVDPNCNPATAATPCTFTQPIFVLTAP